MVRMSAPGTRVVHFGIDGGSFRVLDRLADRGLMPEWDRMRSEAGRAVLRSTTPWFTVPGWITWMTGVPAERHGRIYWTATSAGDYWSRGGAGRRFVTSSDVGYPTVFRLLSDAGMSVGSVNMPVTFPPAAVNGVMISGFGSPADIDRAAHPPGFLRRYPDYRIDAEDSVPRVMGDGDQHEAITPSEVVGYASALTSMAAARHRVAIDLIREGHALVSIVYVGSDRLSHVAWPQVDAVMDGRAGTEAEKAVEAYYRLLDRLLGETRRAAGEGLFLITSDHGQGPPPKRRVAPNAWLAQEGWLFLRTPGLRRATRLIAPALRRRLWSAWRRLRNIPVGSSPHVHWDETVAYAICMPHCRVFGVAVRGDRKLQEDIATSLLALVDPETNRRPVERVVFSDQVCREAARSHYPQLLAFLRPEYGATGRVTGAVVHPAPPGPSGYHEPDGILVASGPGITPGVRPEAGIADIAPTVLTALGVAPPDHMETSAIPWLVPSSDNLRSVRSTPEAPVAVDLTTGERDHMEQHLRDLGYVE
jgi:predicted AlkP superfamily phosphohydrolase/phosphomutase